MLLERRYIVYFPYLQDKLLMDIQGGGYHQGCKGLAKCQLSNLNYYHEMLRTFSMELG